MPNEPNARLAPSAAFVGTVALLCAVPPFATDMYTPAFPQVTHDLATSPAAVGLTLTAFFLGFGFGQLGGGAWSDSAGRRMPLLVGSLICLLGAAACAVAPTVEVMVLARAVHGIGGGIAAAVARAAVVDVARGESLARLMSVLQAIGGLAPMIAPVFGALVITASGWRDVFWVLAVMGVLMVATAALFIPETLPQERRRTGGLRVMAGGVREVLRVPPFVAYILVNTFSSFVMMGYVSNAAYVLQGQKGMSPLDYSFFFAGTAFSQVVLTLVNARLLGRFSPRALIGVGLVIAGIGVALLAVGVFFLGTPLLLTCAGFLLIMSAQAFIFGNAGALAAMEVPQLAGSAAAVQGLAGSLSSSIVAPLATAGGAATAVPMVLVMLTGVTLSFTFFAIAQTIGRRRPA